VLGRTSLSSHARQPSRLPNFLFYRNRLADHLLPQLAVITVTDEVAEWMLELGSWHEEVGDTTAAARVYEELLEEVPDCEAARERLRELEKEGGG
jgi:predicted TPR repeat methyltransferase